MARFNFPRLAPSKGLAIGSGIAQGVNQAIQAHAQRQLQTIQMQTMRAHAAAQMQHYKNMEKLQQMRYGDSELPNVFLSKALGDSENPIASNIAKTAGKNAYENMVVNAPSPAHAMIGAQKLASAWGVGPQQAVQSVAPQEMPQQQQPAQTEPEQGAYGFKPGSRPGMSIVPYSARSILTQSMALRGKEAVAGVQAETARRGQDLSHEAKMAELRAKGDWKGMDVELKKYQLQVQKEIQASHDAARIKSAGTKGMTVQDRSALQQQKSIDDQIKSLQSQKPPALDMITAASMTDEQKRARVADFYAQQGQKIADLHSQKESLQKQYPSLAPKAPGQSVGPNPMALPQPPKVEPSVGGAAPAAPSQPNKISAGMFAGKAIGDVVVHPSNGQQYKITGIADDGKAKLVPAGAQ